jgi:hypothetical protein
MAQDDPTPAKMKKWLNFLTDLGNPDYEREKDSGD